MASRSSATESGRGLGRWAPEVISGRAQLVTGSADAVPGSGGSRTVVAEHRAPGSGDPAVVAALELGWEMADLYAERGSPPPDSVAPATLPSAPELSSPESGIERVATLIGRALGESGVDDLPSVDALREAAQDTAAWREALLAFHIRLITSLGAHEPTSLGAYEVGRALADTCREPRDLSELIERLDAPSLLTVEGRLADLSSRLPPHAAAAVAATLAQWKAWTGDARARENLDEVRGALARQGALWRALLTGEKDARQMLDPETAIAASVRHASRLGTLIRGLAGAYLPATGLLALVSALLVYVVIAQSPVATVVAALGALAGALIVLRKVVSLTVVETIEDLRGGLWGAEIDAAVAQSILRLPPSPVQAPRTKPAPVPPTPGQPQPVSVRLAHRVERALHVTRSARAQGFRVPASGPASAVPESPPKSPGANGSQPA